jgi:ketosteroid isomerase-like protein
VSVELVRRATELASRNELVSDEELAEIFAPDVVMDFSARIFNPHVYHGYDGIRAFYTDTHEIWEELSMTVTEIVEEGNRYLALTEVRARARGSGIEMQGSAAGIWTAEDGRLKHFRLLASERADRDEALAALRANSG